MVACQVIWVKIILQEPGQVLTGSTNINCDNSSTPKLSRNPIMHGRSKQIDVCYHFLKILSTEGFIELTYCRSEDDQVVDIMTKAFKLDAFLKLRSAIGVRLVWSKLDVNYI